MLPALNIMSAGRHTDAVAPPPRDPRKFTVDVTQERIKALNEYRLSYEDAWQEATREG